MPTTSWTKGSAKWARQPASAILLVVFLCCGNACSTRQIPINLEFVATWNGQPLLCGGTGPQLADLRFFVSEIALIDSSGNEHELDLAADGQWQQQGLALIDLESGLDSCVNGSQATNATATGVATDTDYVGLRFTLGVPFELNHANPLTASAPLQDAAMHWHWRSGYKFLRAGVATETDGYWLHLGSTGCEGTVQDITACRNPNRVVVDLPEFSPISQQIEVDLSALFMGIDLNDGMPGDCSSGPAETSCAEPFLALGLGPGDQSQRVFRARP